MSNQPTANTSADKLRRIVRDAMDRLLQGTPFQSDGKLTVKSLAAEAGVKRWVLTHQHPDLQNEFRQRIKNQDKTPDVMQSAIEKTNNLSKRIKELSSLVADLTEENHNLVRVINVLTLENTKMKEELDKRGATVSHLTSISR